MGDPRDSALRNSSASSRRNSRASGGIFPFAYPRIGEAVNSNFLKALGAEFLGTMMFMFILVSQIVFSCYIGEGAEGNKLGASTCLLNPVRVLPIAATAGLTMFVLIYATASFSGGE